METQGNESEVVESVESSEPAVVETPAPVVDPQGQDLKSQMFGKAAKAAPAVEAYKANHKFKVLDKELEFEDWAKGAIKDADTEKKVREFHEKAYGLDSVKTDRQTLKGQLAESNARNQEFEQSLQGLQQAKESKDFDSFFEAWKIEKHDIIQYALDVIKREQDPEAKAQWENNRQTQQQQTQYSQQQQQFQASQREFAVQKRVFELDSELSKPDHSAVVQAYNAGMGKPDAFKDYVAQIGASVFASTGRDIPVAEAIQMAVGHLRAVNPQLGLAQQNGGSPAMKVVSPNQTPVIPNVRGSGGSPVKPAIKSIADMKKRAAEYAQQG